MLSDAAAELSPSSPTHTISSSSSPSSSPSSSSSSSSSPSCAITSSCRRRSTSSPGTRHLRRVLFSLTCLLLSTPPHLRTTLLAEAVTCTSPTVGDTVKAGQSLELAWSVSSFDTYFFDTITATLLCLDKGATDWREVTTLFQNQGLLYNLGFFPFKLPNCGSYAESGAIRITAQGFSGNVQEDDACFFNIEQSTVQPQPLVPSLPPSVSPTGASKRPQIVTANPTATSPTPGPPPATSGTSGAGGATLTPLSSPPQTTLSSGSGSSSSSSSSSGSGSSGGGGNPPSSFPIPTSRPPLPAGGNNGNSGHGGGVGTTENEGIQDSLSSKTLSAALGSIGMAACLAAVVISFLVIRRRRRRRTQNGGDGEKTLARSSGAGGAEGGVMKEAKRRIRLQRKPSEGYFFQIEDEDEEDATEFNEKDHAIATNRNLTVSRDESSAASAAGLAGAADIIQAPVPAALPPPILPNVRRRSSAPFTEMSVGSYSMSSMRSSFETSSIVRQYWAASMAARAERRAEGGRPASSRGALEYEEGSIFGDQSRDSDSRMADILSLRTTGTDGEESSTGTAGTVRRQYRRNTLNSIFVDETCSSFGPRGTMTTSFSSTPDSLLTEEEFLERMHMRQMHQMQEQQEMHYQRYSHHHHHHHQQDYHPQYARSPEPYQPSMASYRTSSVPSLTSTNDPFKTFDSNEVVLDIDPFSDSRAASRASVRSTGSTGREDMYHHRPPSRGPTGRPNSDLFQSFPNPPVLE
ncbi:hypothetical protein BGZ83_003543 [Gryganskiella cystojenkinii]|nr:hypothetical protein BGZ83_003543 [Gryganskiella cystojenkinii]